MVDDAEYAKLAGRVALLERQVDFLMKQLSYQYVDKPAAELYPEVAVLRRQGKLIEAIKLYRTLTNTGLAEAKNYVESIPL